MHTKSLLIIAVVVSIVGLMVLALIRPDVSPQFMQVEGTVEQIENRGSVSIIHFTPKNLTVVSFQEENVGEGDQVLIGRLQQYNGKLEFVVESTREIRAGK